MSGHETPGQAARRHTEVWASGSLFAATGAMGLIAGLFYGWACSVMPGLARVEDRAFIEVMQKINKAILNPVFFASFIGALAMTVIALALQRKLGGREAAKWIAAGLAFYVVSLVITSGVNVPLNDRLVLAGNPQRLANPALVREQFEDKWVVWHAARTVTTTAAFGCLLRALWLNGRRK